MINPARIAAILGSLTLDNPVLTPEPGYSWPAEYLAWVREKRRELERNLERWEQEGLL